MIYYQIGAAVIILLFILIGVYRGIFRTLFNLIGLALSAFLSNRIAGPLAQGVYDSFIRQSVVLRIQEAIMQNGVTSAVNGAVSAFPDWLSNSLGLGDKLAGFGADQLPGGAVISNAQAFEIAQSVEREIYPAIIAVLSVIVTIVLFFILMIIIKLLIRLIIKAMDGPVMRGLNRFFGGVLGAVEGVVLVLFICVIFNIKLFA